MEELTKLVDPRLGDNYPLDSVRKASQIQKNNLNLLCLVSFMISSLKKKKKNCGGRYVMVADGTTSQGMHT